MQGSNVVTSDEHKAGHVVGEQGDYLIVESGTIRKHRHVLPKAFAHAADGAVRVTVPWDILKDSPEADSDGRFDEQAVAEHYGLASAMVAPPTEGDGELVADDPAYVDAGVAAAEQERVAIRENLQPGAAEPPHPSPGVTGGDRYRDAESVKTTKEY